MSLELRRRMMVQAEPKDIIIDARKGGVSGNAANDAALMEVIYAQKWSKSPLYMTQKEAEAVTSVGTAFQGNTEIKDFRAFKYFTSVTTIEELAFENCTGLIDIILPTSVTSIRGKAYAGCTGLDVISIPAKINVVGTFLNNCGTISDLTFTAKNIGEYIRPFDSKYNINKYISNNVSGTDFTNRYIELEEGDIANIVIPDTITTLQACTFLGIKNISHIDLNAVTSIDDRVFAGSTLSSIIIRDTLKSIGLCAFGDITVNHDITIPEGCILRDYALGGITVNGDIYIPKSVIYEGTSFTSGGTGYGTTTFNGKASILITDLKQRLLKGVKVRTLELNQQEITNIGYMALAINNSYYEGNLTELYFPNVETIDDYAFNYVNKFKKIRFGDKVTNIGKNVGRGTCSQGFEIEAIIPPTLSGELTDGQDWFVPRSAQAAYEAAPYWSDLNAAGKLLYLENL